MSSLIDKLLSRSSHVAQIALVVVAIYGYFYTVVPVYQKELLSEEISQKEIELIKLKEQIKQFPQTIKALKDNARQLEARISDLQEARSEAEQSIASILDEKERLQKSLHKLRRELKTARDAADKAYTEIYLESFKGAVLFQYLKHFPNPYDILKKQNKSLIDSFLVTPYQAVLAVLDDGNPNTLESTRLVPKRIRDTQNSIIRKKLMEHRHTLSRPLSDIQQIVSDYNREMAAANKDKAQEGTFNQYQYQLTREYADRLSKARNSEMERSSKFMEQF